MALGRSNNLKPASTSLAGEEETQEIVLPVQDEGETTRSSKTAVVAPPIAPSLPKIDSGPLDPTSFTIQVGTETILLDKYQFFRLRDKVGRTTNFNQVAADHVKLAMRAYLGI